MVAWYDVTLWRICQKSKLDEGEGEGGGEGGEFKPRTLGWNI